MLKGTATDGPEGFTIDGERPTPPPERDPVRPPAPAPEDGPAPAPAPAEGGAPAP